MHEDDTITKTQLEPYAKHASPTVNCPFTMPMYHLNSVVLIQKRRTKPAAPSSKRKITLNDNDYQRLMRNSFITF
jgi:hypothetical protein